MLWEVGCSQTLCQPGPGPLPGCSLAPGQGHTVCSRLPSLKPGPSLAAFPGGGPGPLAQPFCTESPGPKTRRAKASAPTGRQPVLGEQQRHGVGCYDPRRELRGEQGRVQWFRCVPGTCLPWVWPLASAGAALEAPEHCGARAALLPQPSPWTASQADHTQRGCVMHARSHSWEGKAKAHTQRGRSGT